MESNQRLFVDLVPKTAWFSNLRSELTGGEWEMVKQLTFTKAGYACEVCGGRGSQHPVECHERWDYNEATCVQTLIGTIALCPSCHQSTHYGLADVRGQGRQALAHLMRVNRWSKDQAECHIKQAFIDWSRRNRMMWILDARWIISVVPLSEKTVKKINDHASSLAGAKNAVNPARQTTESKKRFFFSFGKQLN